MTEKQKWLLLGIILVAIFFRFYKIAEMPGGLFPDEAANGLDINLMQAGHLQPFYERGNGREALFFYMLWGSVAAFGKGAWQHHIVSAGVGVVSVLLCFLLAQKLFSLTNFRKATTLALLASFFMATNTWNIVLSRTAFRANLIPLFTSLTFYLLLLAYSATTTRKRLLWAALTGASFALGFYSYIAYRVMVPILVVIILWPLLVDFFSKPRLEQTKKFIAPIILSAVMFGIFIFPLARYFYTHPGSFVGRSGQVSVFNPDQYLYNGQQLHGKPPLSVVINVVGEVWKKSMLAYFTNGDLNWRHNISGFLFLSILVSPFFAIGLIAVTLLAIRYFFKPKKYKEDWQYFLLAGWFWGMMLPVITTAEGIPHGLRSLGTVPTVFIISAYGLMVIMGLAEQVVNKFWDKLTHWKQKILTVAFSAKTVAYVAAIILQSFIAYFVYAYNSPENFYAFRSDLTVVSNYLKQHCDKTHTYLVLDKFSVQTTDYLTSDPKGNFSDKCNVPYIQVDPEDSWKLAGLEPGDQIVFTQSSLFDTKKFKQYHSEARLMLERRNKFNQTVMGVYKIN